MGYMDSLVLYYDMSEHAIIQNLAPNTYGSYNGIGAGLTSSSIVNGVGGGKGLYFDGGNDHIQLLLAFCAFMQGKKDFTISVFFKSSSYGDGRKIFSLEDSNGDGVVLNHLVGGVVYFAVNAVGSSSGVLPDDVIFHAVAVRDASELQYLYINGDLVDSDDSSAQTVAVTTDPRIGIASYNLANDYQGMLDEMMFFDSALTQLQAIDLGRRIRMGRL